MGSFDNIRDHFPIFAAHSNSEFPLAYLDTAASAQKPRIVIERLTNYLSFEHANIRRGAYRLSSQASINYEESRAAIARFVGAPKSSNIVFTRGTTEGINLVARSLERVLGRGDSVLLTELEHHSNIVPWQLLQARTGVALHYGAITADCAIDTTDLIAKIHSLRPKLLSITWLSNAFGSWSDLKPIIAAAKSVGSWVLVDAAQVVAHYTVNAEELGADFLVFSGHKMYGPTGVGVLFVAERMYEFMEPFCGGGDMIERVSIGGSTWAKPPHKFEAGTPAIAEVIALRSSVDFLQQFGVQAISEQIERVWQFGLKTLSELPGVTVYGSKDPARHKAVLAFNIDGIHPHDVASVADSFNVQLRAGHHCAMPALHRLGLDATVRASVGIYSTAGDFNQLALAIKKVQQVFG